MSLSNDVNLDIAADATRQTSWFAYDATGRVTLDGAQLSADGVLSLGTTGQYLEYDAVGNNTLVITNGPSDTQSAQLLGYNRQGLLASVNYAVTESFESRFNNPNPGAIRTFSPLVTHDYDLDGLRIQTDTYYQENSPFSVTLDFDQDQRGDQRYFGFLESREVLNYSKDGIVDSVTRRGWTDVSQFTLQTPNQDPDTESNPHFVDLDTSTYAYDNAGRLAHLQVRVTQPGSGSVGQAFIQN